MGRAKDGCKRLTHAKQNARSLSCTSNEEGFSKGFGLVLQEQKGQMYL